MRLLSSFAFVVSASLLVVACGDNIEEGGDAPPSSVHEQSTRAPIELPRLPSKLLVNVPRAYPLARTKAGMLRGIGAASGPDGISGTNTAAFVSTGRSIVQKTLLLAATGSEPAYLAAKSSLDRIGVPYQSVIATQQTFTADMLTDSVSTCYFNSVILTTDSLGYVDGTGAWVSALTADQWQMLADFEAACSAREAIWYAYPNPSLGLNWPTGSWDWTTPVDATVVAPSFFSGVRSTALVPVRYAAGYQTQLADAATTALLQDGAGNVMMALHTFADGRQAVVSTFDQSPYLTHSWLLEYDLVRWVTGGMFLGKKRAYLTAQVDDVFIDDDMWIAAIHNNDSSVQFRITGTDIDSLVTWQNGFRQKLPSGSAFSAVFAFNGIGTKTTEYADTTLLNEALKYNKSFLWLSHTWDHTNMDAMLQSDAYTEANKNIKLASNDKLNGFNRGELVTPDVSGLGNYAALEGLFQAGVREVVSNTSIATGANPSFNVGMANALEPRIYEVPRHPTNVFYDVATPDNETDEYNTHYPQFNGLTYQQVLDKDTDIGVSYLFTGDIDPLMFHQPNLANYNAGTSLPPASLYGDWVAAVAGKFNALTPAPIKTLQQRDIAVAMQQRGAYNGCGLTATIVESSTGSRTLQLQALNACVVPVTGLSSTAGSVETYLGTPTTSITMTAGSQKSIALP